MVTVIWERNPRHGKRHFSQPTALWMEGGKIVNHGHPSQPIPTGGDVRVIDASSCYVIPSEIDVQSSTPRVPFGGTTSTCR